MINREMARLVSGFRRFRERFFEETGEDLSVYQRLAANAQSPKTLLIGCSDSRVDPALLTGAGPGEIFVVRNVANLIPPCESPGVGHHGTSSALEFAVETLKVENIVVLGHRQCGGIGALMRGATIDKDSFIGPWMSIAEDARRSVLENHPQDSFDSQCRLAEMESIKVSLRNLRTYPFVNDAVRERQLNIFGAYFDLEKGELWAYEEPKNLFRLLEI